MRPTAAVIILVLLCAALAAGCSERASRLTGNERLLRGDQGLGTTLHSDTLVDSDTYAGPGTSEIRGATLLVGREGSYEARSLLRRQTSWTLPDTLAVIDTIRFRLEFEGRVNADLPDPSTQYSLHLAGAAWDSATVEWPGPPVGTLLGAGSDAVAPFTVNLAPSEITQVRAWAADPSFPGFVLTLDSGTGVRGFVAGTGRIEIVYHHTLGTGSGTAVTQLPTDLTIQAPASPAAGNETTLRLGGFFQSEVLLRAPVAPPPAGFSINAAQLVAQLQGPSAPDTVEIKVYRIRNAWTEGSVTVDSLLGLDATPLETLTGVRVLAGDSLTIPIPIGVAREWSADSTSNHGVLLRVTNSFFAAEIAVASRESASPPLLRISTTSPPPGRF